MCRWLAYSGGPIFLEEAIIKPKHSLIEQSIHAHSGATTTNGDGFGIGWYGRREVPGVYRDLRPAWNDENLRSIASQVESHLFIAHVRATTGTAVQRSNCHPFRYRNWLFVHNGQIRGFDVIRRELALAVSPGLFGEISGLAGDVAGGLSRMVGFVESVGQKNGIGHPMQMTLGISDGRSLYACRYSTERQSRTLYHSASIDAVREIAPRAGRFTPDSRAIVSEPLSDLEEAWIPVPESSLVTVSAGEVVVADFAPIQ